MPPGGRPCSMGQGMDTNAGHVLWSPWEVLAAAGSGTQASSGMLPAGTAGVELPSPAEDTGRCAAVSAGRVGPWPWQPQAHTLLCSRADEMIFLKCSFSSWPHPPGVEYPAPILSPGPGHVTYFV